MRFTLVPLTDEQREGILARIAARSVQRQREWKRLKIGALR